MKNLVALLLAVLMLASLAACAKEENNQDDLHDYLQAEEVVDFEVYGDDTFYLRPIDTQTVAITGYKGKDTLHSVTVPARMANRNVAVIEEFAFKDCTAITSIKLPETVEVIGNYAFAGCLALENVTIPSGVTKISKGAFYSCTSMTSVSFKEGSQIEAIEDNAFNSCTALKSFVVPETVKTIGAGAFFGCTDLASVTLSEGVEELGAQAFQNCKDLTDVTLPASLQTFGVSRVDGGSLHLIFAGCGENEKGEKLEIKVTAPAGSDAEAYFQSEHAVSDAADKCLCGH